MSAQHGVDVTLSLIVGFYTRIRAELNSFPLTDFFKSTTATMLLVESLSSSYSPLCTHKYFTKQPSWLSVKRSSWMGSYSRSVRKSLCLMFNLSVQHLRIGDTNLRPPEGLFAVHLGWSHAVSPSMQSPTFLIS